MKIFKSFFLIALMALSFSLHANDEKPAGKFKVATEIVNDNAIIYLLSNLQQLNTTLRITNIEGNSTFFQTNVRKHNGFRGKVSMEQLQDGRYLLEVNQGNMTKRQVIVMRDGKIEVSQITD